MNEDKKRELLIAFNENADLKEAVKEELLKGIYKHGVIVEGVVHDPLRNWALSLVFNDGLIKNEDIGAKLCAIAEGVRFLESSFKDIENDYKPTNADGGGEDKNPAR